MSLPNFTVDRVVADTLTKNLTLLYQLFLIALRCFGNAIGMRRFSVFNDILVLVGCRRVLGKIRPVSLSLSKGCILKWFGGINGAREFI
jgi:hypothetical protein